MSQMKFLSYLTGKELTPNEYYILYSITINTSINPNVKVDMDSLHRRNFLIKCGPGWEPTRKTKEILKYVDSLYKEETQTSQKSKYSAEVLEKLAVFINQTFPTKTTGGRMLRSNKRDVKEKLRKFFLKYPEYEPINIANAVEKYIEHQSVVNDTLIMKSGNFILKNNVSALADWCENIKE